MSRWHVARGIVALALATAACGVRTRPLPPELVQPEPPTALVASSNVDGVRLTWRRPSQYSGGKHMRVTRHGAGLVAGRLLCLRPVVPVVLRGPLLGARPPKLAELGEFL